MQHAVVARESLDFKGRYVLEERRLSDAIRTDQTVPAGRKGEREGKLFRKGDSHFSLFSLHPTPSLPPFLPLSIRFLSRMNVPSSIRHPQIGIGQELLTGKPEMKRKWGDGEIRKGTQM